jgi:mono/diheme cytochrome c family protein
MKPLKTVVLTLAVLAIGGLLFVVSGAYDMGADTPHWPVTHRVLTLLRDRSIATRSVDLTVPNLADPRQISKGAGQYAAMCVGCHLAPGVSKSEIRSGLYPQPPNLATARIPPAQAFWAIKHGIKMSAMPAWGSSHDGETIWSMVAFLRILPTLTAEQYKQTVAEAPSDDDMDMKMDDNAAPADKPGA